MADMAATRLMKLGGLCCFNCQEIVIIGISFDGKLADCKYELSGVQIRFFCLVSMIS